MDTGDKPRYDNVTPASRRRRRPRASSCRWRTGWTERASAALTRATDMPEAPPASKPAILVAEDSITSRMLIKSILDREKKGSTGFGKGVAVPHVKHDKIKKMAATGGGAIPLSKPLYLNFYPI